MEDHKDNAQRDHVVSQATGGTIPPLCLNGVVDRGFTVMAYSSFSKESPYKDEEDDDEEEEGEDLSTSAYVKGLRSALSGPLVDKDCGVVIHALLWIDETLSSSRDAMGRLTSFESVGRVSAMVLQTNPKAASRLFRPGTWLEVTLSLPKGVPSTLVDRWSFLGVDEEHRRDSVVLRFPLWPGEGGASSEEFLVSKTPGGFVDHQHHNHHPASPRESPRQGGNGAAPQSSSSSPRPSSRGGAGGGEPVWVRRCDQGSRDKGSSRKPLPVVEYRLPLSRPEHSDDLLMLADEAMARATGMRTSAYSCKGSETRAYDEEDREIKREDRRRSTNQLVVVFEAESSWPDPRRYLSYPPLSVSFDGSPWTNNEIVVQGPKGARLDKRTSARACGKHVLVEGLSMRPPSLNNNNNNNQHAIGGSSVPSSPLGLAPATIAPPSSSPRGYPRPSSHSSSSSLPVGTKPPPPHSARVEWVVRGFHDQCHLSSDTTEVALSIGGTVDRIQSRDGILRPSRVEVVHYRDTGKGDPLLDSHHSSKKGSSRSNRKVVVRGQTHGVALQCRHTIGLGVTTFSVVTRNIMADRNVFVPDPPAVAVVVDKEGLVAPQS